MISAGNNDRPCCLFIAIDLSEGAGAIPPLRYTRRVTSSGDFHFEWMPHTASGRPSAVIHTADGRTAWLHSRVDPEEEARFLVRDLPRQPRTMYVVLGYGLGYHIQALLDSISPDSHIVVIEADDGLLSETARAAERTDIRRLMSSGRVHHLVGRDPAVLPLRLAASFSAFDVLRLQMFTHLPSTRVGTAFYQAAAAIIPERLPAASDAHLDTIDSTLEHDLRNFWSNLRCTWQGGDIDRLKNVWSDRPLVLVSAGPSLTAALPALAQAKGRALVMATAPTAAVLMAAGIRPDVVVTVDPFEPNAAHFAGWDSTGVPLVYYHRTFRAIPANYRGPLCAFSMRDERPLPLRADARPGSFFPGGTVAFSALQLAHHMGANPVIFVGQDFSFAAGRTHAEGVVWGRDVQAGSQEAPLEVPGVNGGVVRTNGLYYSYLVHMQAYLLAFEKLHPKIRHFNASSGAAIAGTEPRSLEDALAESAARDSGAPSTVVAARDALVTALSNSTPAPASERDVLIRRWRSELKALMSASEIARAPFDELFAAFASTSLYEQAPETYRRIRYVYESRYVPRGSSAQTQFRDRFVAHLSHIATELDQLSADAGNAGPRYRGTPA